MLLRVMDAGRLREMLKELSGGWITAGWDG